MNQQHEHQYRPQGPKFAPGGGHWPGAMGRTQSSDSDTERGRRSMSRSEVSSYSRRRRLPDFEEPQSPDEEEEDDDEDVRDSTPEAAPPIPYWSAKRHLTCGNPTPGPPWSSKNIAWRGSAPGKLKTANAALVLCLNIDVDPPDVVKTNPCAVLECWVDPHTMPSHKALEAIGSNLQRQFEGLSLKIAYKPILDPSLEDLRRFCQSLRKQAKDDAVLFHYNGHGVPKPTPSGELWCFNRNYTQYIPVSLQEVQSWLGSPGVYIWDCSAAGHLLHNFNVYAERRDAEQMKEGGFPDGMQPMMNSLQLAACGANENLPTCPELPADVFTSCLTSPIDIALRYFIMNHHLPNNVTADMVMQLPGDLKDRRTPLGELNWIFTAITDTIAWTTFSHETFTRLYRCDLLIASLFRNFLLAERIMKDYNCTPHTCPPLPATNTHPLWATWDLAVDSCLRQLPDLLNKAGTASGTASSVSNVGTAPGAIGRTSRPDPDPIPMKQPGDKPFVYTSSRFFADQLTAFEVWISRGGSALTKKGPLSLPGANTLGNGDAGAIHDDQSQWQEGHLVPRKPPDQLPIVLQVLLSQPHRLRALILLSQFVDLGPWAVHLVLSIGIFPYISKLLQAAGQDLRPVLIFIWARILAVDSSVQTDLYNSNGYKYFASILRTSDEDSIPNSSEHKAMCSFILASICRDFPLGQAACLEEKVFENCSKRLGEPDFLLRQWTALCIAQMWDGNSDIKVHGVDQGTQDRLIQLLSDDSAEVRSASLYALSTFMGASGSANKTKRGGGGTGSMSPLEEETHFTMELAVVTGATLLIKDDASPMCRKELLVLISCLVKEWRGYFVICAWIYWEEDQRWRSGANHGAPPPQAPPSGHHYSYSSHYRHVHNQGYDEDLASQTVLEWLDGLVDEEREDQRAFLTSFFTIFVALLDLSVDPYPEVATNAQTIVDYIMALLIESPFARLSTSTLHTAPSFPFDRRSPSLRGGPGTAQSSPILPSPHPEHPGLTRTDSMGSTISNSVTSTLRRTHSALRMIANTVAFPTSATDNDTSRSRIASPTLASLGFFPQPSRSISLSGSSTAAQSSDLHKPDLTRPPSPHMNTAEYVSPYSYSTESGRGSPTPPPPPQSPGPYGNNQGQDHEEFVPCHVFEALIEEDMQRLKARRGTTPHNRYSHQHGYGSSGHGTVPSPSNSTFSSDSRSSLMVGLGTGKNLRDVLPLRSDFFDWCAEYFKEPQMRQAEADEPGSKQYNYQVWRQQRNEGIIDTTTNQAPAAEMSPWNQAVTSFSTNGMPLTMRFHSFDKRLFLGDENNIVSIWDWSTRRKLKQFCNGNPRGSSITSLEIINQDVGGIIVVGSSDGVVRLYRNYDPDVDQEAIELVSAFRGLTEMVSVRQGTGMVMDWKQSAGILLLGGDSRVIKVWDAQTETQSLDIETGTDSPLTSIVSESGPSQTFVAGFADGSIKVFDRRMDEEVPIVRSFHDSTAWVQNVRWHPVLSSQFLSGGRDGQVRLFDLRTSDQATMTWKQHSDGLASFDVHPLAAVFASASATTPNNWLSQRISIQGINTHTHLTAYNTPSGLSSPLRPFPSPYIHRHTSLVFHPREMLYAIGAADGTIRINGCRLV